MTGTTDRPRHGYPCPDAPRFLHITPLGIGEAQVDGPRYRVTRRAGAARTAASARGVSAVAIVAPRGYRVAKRALDIVGAACGLLLFAPLLLLVALLVALDSPGPVVHRRRVLAFQPGADAADTPSLAAFDAFKFRTMRADADAWLARRPELLEAFRRDYKLAEDPRVTRLGRFLRRTSIDELPQLVNVLIGQMSLVGPRMITRDELIRYGAHAPGLLAVTPGLTGLWQVSGRSEVGYDERVRLDMAYIADRSVRLDVEILLRTVGCVLRRRGAC